MHHAGIWMTCSGSNVQAGGELEAWHILSSAAVMLVLQSLQGGNPFALLELLGWWGGKLFALLELWGKWGEKPFALLELWC